ncbi:MarR family winged helix-turn-helix transcriptional regulator [Actinomadura chibensis]|uniref:MarR family transcriptional regulator n=1 Tax=Actinomadura chibensis TaxID=392828 RepID=A0A5D0NLQ2_9ACTN|nr:MarR family transcriptional regulator [Actinomadura chibensis]TYB45229.1 MarR family transcriptional regulator [Actinomadura chibensis]
MTADATADVTEDLAGDLAEDLAEDLAGDPADGVDPLVMGVRDRWEAQGLSGGPWPFMAICAVGRLNQLLKKALDAELKGLDLSRTGYFLLTTLALTTRGQARLSTLGRILMVHPTTVKLTVDQLEAAGFVARTPHPRDRRATLVRITAAGRDRANEVALALEAPESALAVFDDMHRDVFEALQPARLAAGDVELLNPDERRG